MSGLVHDHLWEEKEKMLRIYQSLFLTDQNFNYFCALTYDFVDRVDS